MRLPVTGSGTSAWFLIDDVDIESAAREFPEYPIGTDE